MYPHNAIVVEAGEHPDYPRTDVPALGPVALVAQAPHQLGESPGGAGHLPTGLPNGCGEPETGQGGGHNVEGVGGIASMGDGVSQRPDDVHELDDGTGEAVADDQWHSIRLRRTDVQEVDVLPFDGGDELR